MQSSDLVVIGGGIVGTATAMSLLCRFPGLKLTLLEKEAQLAAHQTGHNSGVIHSGLYYRPGSLKARTCAEGREALYRFCEERGIRHERCGKLVVATDPGQIDALDELERRGRENGLLGVERLDAAGIRNIEPHAAGIAGLYVPQTGIVDYREVTRMYGCVIIERGGEVRTGCCVNQVVRQGDGFRVRTSQGDICCRYLINCAGLQSDRVAKMCGVASDTRIVPFRGEYYDVESSRSGLVKNLIYPVPDPAFPFLGVHFTRMCGGGLEAGPNAVLALEREGYGRFPFSFRDCLEMIAFAGFRRLARRYWRVGLLEYRRSFSKRLFVRDLQRLVPELTAADVRPGGVGIRAQAVDREGRLLDDFCLLAASGMIHVLNAPSPAATASISIGQTISRRAAEHFHLNN